MADPGALVEDDLLRLVLMCTHPALAPEAASALTLRLVLGVPTPDIARLFLVPEPTMAARITRAKKRIVGAGIPFGVPDASVLPDRLDTVAQTAYLAFTAGYSPGTGADLLRADALRRGHRPGPRRPRAASRRARARGAAGADAVPALASRRAGPRRSTGAASRPGPHPVAPRRDRRGTAPARRAGAARPDHGAGCGVHPAGADRRGARAGADGRRDAVGAHRRAVRPPAARWRRRRARAWPGRSPSPRRGARPPVSPRWRASRSRRRTASPPYAPSCWRAPVTSTPRGRPTTRRSRPASTTSSART